MACKLNVCALKFLGATTVDLKLSTFLHYEGLRTLGNGFKLKFATVLTIVYSMRILWKCLIHGDTDIITNRESKKM